MKRHYNAYYSLILVAVFTCFASVAAFAQTDESSGKFVQVPNESAVIVIAEQDHYPVTIETARPYISLADESFHIEYGLRNNASGNIRRIVLSKWHLGGGGGDLVAIDVNIPSGGVFAIGDINRSGVVELNGELKKKLGLDKNKMIGVILVFVKDVWLDDGTHFADEKTEQNLRGFLDRIELRD